MSSKSIEEEVKLRLECNGVSIIAEYPHLNSKLSAICDSPKFTDWVKGFFDQKEITLQEFHVTDVDFFGPVNPSRLGFVKGFGIAHDATNGDAIPAIAFIRGGAVAVLIIVNVVETGAKYVLLCKQLRFPSGGMKVEACAGMVDHRTATVVGVAFNEVKEETGFVITESDLIQLGQITPSAGGCDEIIHLYAWETSINQEEFEEKQRKVYGEGQYEKIKLLFYPFDKFDDVLDQIGDVKAECCWRRYLNFLKRNCRASLSATETA